jgi:hypothetical protein
MKLLPVPPPNGISVMRIALLVLAATLSLLLGAPASAKGAFTAFKSPNGNITCVIRVSPPDQPDQPDFAQCELRSMRTGGGFLLRRRGRVQRYDVGEDDLRSQRFTLGYGSKVSHGPFVCRLRRSGMTCRSRTSGHGFKLSRERQRTF